MDAPETFARPPISEALIDIQVSLPPESDIARLEAFQDLVIDRFPNKLRRAVQGFQISGGSNAQAEVKPAAVQGFVFSSPDKSKVVQAGLGSFTFNKLKPYEKWESFSSEAKELWEKYLAFAKPINVTRIGLRYVNNIDLPLPVQSLETYISGVPSGPSGSDLDVSGFFMQMSVRQRTSAAAGIVTHTFNPVTHESKFLSYILDIDVSLTFSVLAPDTDKIFTHIDLLRDLKNKIFFSSITEETRKLFR